MMAVKDWLDFFKQHKETKIFYLQHLRLLTKMRRRTLLVALKRLNEKKIIRHICRSYYANPFNLPSLEEIASVIYLPSYISLESALARWGVLSQIPQVLTCVTTKLPRQFNTAFGSIEYHQLKKKYFWGFIQEADYFIAEPEKALLDYLYLKRKKDLKKAFFELDLTHLNLKKLELFTRRMKIILPKSLF